MSILVIPLRVWGTSWFPPGMVTLHGCQEVVGKALCRSLSDHKPIVLKEKRSKNVFRPFKWFNHWAEDQILAGRIRNLCVANEGIGINKFLLLVKIVTKDREREVRALNPDSLEEIGNKIDVLEERWLSDPSNSQFQHEISSLKYRLWTAARKEEREWLQKSRLWWFKEGTKTQNSSISQQFQGLKRFDIPLKRINLASKKFIESPFSEEEVWVAVKSLDGTRAPGPDDFSLDFFKKFWKYIKGEVMRFVEEFYWGKVEDISFKKSYIALIPKKLEAISPADFRPISLVGSMYKIVSRLLAKRLGSCLSEVIREHQFAFMAGKQIADCSLIANEVIDGLFKTMKEAVLIKAYFSKAFDTVDCQFLNLILKKMGFGRRWRKWVNFCISTPSIVVLVNDSPSNSFSIKRGLRQGCPLSLLLFNIVGEALTGMFKKALDIGLCRGWKLGPERYSVEKDSLWRKIVVAKYNYDQVAILPKAINHRTSSWVWRSIVNFLGPLVSNFLVDLRAVSVVQGRDRVIWSGSLDGIYNPKTYCTKVACEGLLEDPVWSLVWFKFVPSKVSVFVWKAVHLRLTVMVELAKRGVNCSDQISCLFCNVEPKMCSLRM
ncbi:hypothetical protein F3Y22_tig00116951pilonHSYRG00119 [Hibiscus syriacus]|uniref:Reverse transcriptase domain-containing protein n=1 Tax=Hibiscus syriacus TaxID=106335 RepID=A0A6A2WMD5_HIBSY|nr:hypothetical protein F3Y22_tig00116951pilonHSYRG00119 [Hibiscus syriacus]